MGLCADRRSKAYTAWRVDEPDWRDRREPRGRLSLQDGYPKRPGRRGIAAVRVQGCVEEFERRHHRVVERGRPEGPEILVTFRKSHRLAFRAHLEMSRR